MTCSLTKATHISFINGKCHIKKQKSYKIGLTGFYMYLSHESLVVPSGWTHTHVHTYTHAPNPQTKATSRNQMCAWFKQLLELISYFVAIK